MARQKLVPESLAQMVTFLPYDLPGACRRAIAALRPDVLVLEYTELWPQLIEAASAAGVKLALTNGRLRPRNVPRYRLLFRLVGNLLERFDVLMMRADDEAERALLLGAPRDRVHVTGNTKFDALAVSVPAEEDVSLRQALALQTGRLWVCGSTHEGEEAALLRVAPVLNLAADPLCELAKGECRPEKINERDGFAQFNTRFHDMAVNAYLVWDPASRAARSARPR